MSLISLSFIVFILILLAFYYALPARFSPYVLLAGSIYFYLQFDLRFSCFLVVSIITTYFGSKFIHRSTNLFYKKIILLIILLINIGILFFVKFVPYICGLISSYLNTYNLTLSILVPIGISFYTLQLCGYCIDIYRNKYTPENNLLKYASFATFFPLIIQGPISRYDQLSKTLFAAKDTTNFYSNLTGGAQLMLWGFFKKLVIADRTALLVNTVFDNFTEYSGISVIIASFCYTLQIYTDFSGCVDICKGAAKLFGVEVIENFSQPYLSTSIQDFWRRWHIALSSWFRDYLYIPLGGNRKGTVRKYLNLLIVFFVSGLWHGVGFQFIVWGLLHGIYQVIGALTMPLRISIYEKLHIDRKATVSLWIQRLITLNLVNLAWVFFRAGSTKAAIHMIKSVFTIVPVTELLPGISIVDALIILFGVLLLFVVGLYREKGLSISAKISTFALPIRWSIYFAIFLITIILGIYGPGYSDASFIYMNF